MTKQQAQPDLTTALKDRFFDKALPINGGGSWRMKFNAESIATITDNYNLFLASRKLGDAQLIERLESDTAMLQNLAGYSKDQAHTALVKEYDAFRDEAWGAAVMVSLCDENFDEQFEGQGNQRRIAVSLKASVLTAADGSQYQLNPRPNYWDNTAENDRRALKFLKPPLPEKTQGSPAEKKLFLISALVDDPNSGVSQSLWELYMSVVVLVGMFRVAGGRLQLPKDDRFPVTRSGSNGTSPTKRRKVR